MTGIYKVTNIITKDFYIGAAKDIKARWSMHKAPSKIKSQRGKLADAYRKYGISNFEFEVIEECTLDVLYEREKYWISSLKPAYNMCAGGKGVSGRIYTDAQLKVMSENQKAYWRRMTEDQKQYIKTHCLIGPRKGHLVSEETRKKLRVANLGKKQTSETIAKRSRSQKIAMIGNTNGNKAIFATNEDGAFIWYFQSAREAAKHFNVDPSTITGCLRGRRKHSCGYKWFYASVETNPDECKGVGLVLSQSQVRGNLRQVEEIVHSDRMVNYQDSDRAYVQLAIRSGQFKKINVTDVRQGELVGRDRRTGEMKFNWIEDEAARSDAPVIGYLGYFRLVNGYEKESYWSVKDLEKHGMRYSQTFGSKYENVRNQSKWATDFDVMCRKTVLKLMLNKGDAPLSVQVQQAIKFDQSVIRDENDKPEYIDNNVEEAVAVEVAEAANKTELPEENQPIGKQEQPEIFK